MPIPQPRVGDGTGAGKQRPLPRQVSAGASWKDGGMRDQVRTGATALPVKPPPGRSRPRDLPQSLALARSSRPHQDSQKSLAIRSPGRFGAAHWAVSGLSDSVDISPGV